MMAIQKRVNSSRPIIYLGIMIMILCLMTGIDVISGFWQPSNKSVPIIQSGNDQDEVEDHSVEVLHNHPTCIDAIDAAQQLCSFMTYLEGIKCQVNRIYLSSSHGRAPPVFS